MNLFVLRFLEKEKKSKLNQIGLNLTWSLESKEKCITLEVKIIYNYLDIATQVYES